MGPYSVPAEILAHKPPGTMVKKISGNYYVYNYTSKKIKITDDAGNTRRSTKTKIGKCIGKITIKDGFIPNENKLKEDEYVIKDYGCYAFAYQSSQETFSLIKKHFQLDDANLIYCLALIHFVNGFTYTKKVQFVYETSYLSLLFPNIRTGYDSVSNLYRNLGSKARRVEELSQELIDLSSRLLTFDGHVISCTSEDNYLSEYGYKYKKINSKQINWLTIYDMQTGTPLVSRFYNGAIPDQSLVKGLFEIYNFKNTHFNVDRGFNNPENKKLFSKNGNTYTIPMISNRKSYKYVLENLSFLGEYNFIYKGKSFLYREFQGSDNDRYLAYKDLAEENKEKEIYLQMIEQGEPGYSENDLKKKEILFGLFLLETNNFHLTPKEIFSTYKGRWQIETYYNYVKNKEGFHSLHQQDYYKIQGLSFIISISGIIYHDVKKALGKRPLTNTFDTLKALVIHLENNKWEILNMNKKIRETCDEINFSTDLNI